MKGLLIRSPWIDLILSGVKTWELRTRPTSIRGRIALIKAGSGAIWGTAVLVDCLPALSAEQMAQTEAFHGISPERIPDVVKNGWTTPWVLRDIEKLPSPLPYSHPSGAVTWVDLPEPPFEPAPASSKAITNSTRPNETAKASTEQNKGLPASADVSFDEWVDIPLTDGNIRNGHFYLRTAIRLLPADCIGGSNKSQLANNIRVKFSPGMLVETDIAGDKMILRSRSQIRDFFDRTGASAGDVVRFGRRGDHDFVVTLVR